MVLYRSPECCSNAELAQAWKYMTICCISFHRYRSIRKHLTVIKMVKLNPALSYEKIWKYLNTRCCIPSFKVISLLVPKKQIFEGFFHIWAWKPSWSYNTEHLNKVSFPTSHGGSIWNLNFNSFCFLSEEDKFENVESEWSWTKVNEWPWPWVVINCHLIIYLTIFTNFHLTGFNSFSEIYSLSIFPYTSKRDQIWPCCKTDQGQPRVMIWINLVVLK